MRKLTFPIAVLATMLVVGLVIFRTTQGDRSPDNVLFIVVDTLRADALGVYGNSMGLSQHIDDFSTEAIVFDQAWAQGAYTMASYMSYMSSTHVRTHGLDGNLAAAGICGWDDLKMLPEALNEHGFRSTAYVSNSNLHPKKGFPRGFDTWNDLAPEELGSNSLKRSEYDIGDVQVVRRGVAAMARWSKDERNFLYLHTLGPHLPLTPSKAARKKVGLPTNNTWKPIHLQQIRRLRAEHTKEDEERTRLAYLADVFDADRAVGEILAGLEQSGHADDTVVILFSDHGEEIWEHGDYGHQDGVWEQLIRVPLVIRVPGRKPGRVSGRLVGLIDIIPSLLPILGIEEQHPWQGVDLFTSTERQALVSQRFEERAISTADGFKGIWRKSPRTKSWRYFQLETDPTEQQPLPAEKAPQNDLKAQAIAWAEQTPAVTRPRKGEAKGICGNFSEREQQEHNELLRALGYVEY
jgi:arylsulfatase A-like enzyme